MKPARTTRWLPTTTLVVCTTLAALPAAAEARWQIAAKAGRASVEETFGPGFLGWRVDDEDTTAAIEVGYSLHRNFALQAGYRDLGGYPGLPLPCPDVCPATLTEPVTPDAAVVAVHPEGVDFEAFTLAAVPRWPLSERLWMFAKVGALDWQGDVTRFFLEQDVDDPSGTDLFGGLGAEYRFESGLSLLVEYETSELVDALSLGAGWRF